MSTAQATPDTGAPPPRHASREVSTGSGDDCYIRVSVLGHGRAAQITFTSRLSTVQCAACLTAESLAEIRDAINAVLIEVRS